MKMIIKEGKHNTHNKIHKTIKSESIIYKQKITKTKKEKQKKAI